MQKEPDQQVMIERYRVNADGTAVNIDLVSIHDVVS